LPNKNYISGRNFEYRTKYFLEKRGWFVMRSHGSKGIFDLVAFPPFVKEGWFNISLGIQCKKNGYIPPHEREKLNKSKNKWQMMILISWSDKKTRQLKFRTLDGEIIPTNSFDFLNKLKK